MNTFLSYPFSLSELLPDHYAFRNHDLLSWANKMESNLCWITSIEHCLSFNWSWLIDQCHLTEEIWGSRPEQPSATDSFLSRGGALCSLSLLWAQVLSVWACVDLMHAETFKRKLKKKKILYLQPVVMPLGNYSNFTTPSSISGITL